MIVVDANLVVALAIPTPYSDRATERVDHWLEAGVDLAAPALWTYEAISAIRKQVSAERMSQGQAFSALSGLLSIPVREIPATESLHQSTLLWADRLQDFVAYDAAYLAVAEHLQVPFWTADGKLVRKVRALGIDWVYDLADVPDESSLSNPSPR